MLKKQLFWIFLSCVFISYSQEYFPENYGVKTPKNKVIAFKNATIYVTPKNKISNGTLLVKNGKIENVGSSISIPNGAEIIDLKGKHIYPSFIELYSNFGIAKPSRAKRSMIAQYDASRKGYYWNDHIRPDINPINTFAFDKKKATDFIKAGFGVVNTHQQDGIIRGNSLLVSLNPTDNSQNILNKKSAQYLSFNKSITSRQQYPGSLMGAMALIRQAYNDAKWYAGGNAKNNDLALEALNNNANLPQIFLAGSKLNAARADKIGDEFGIQYVLIGGGDEYEDIETIKNTNATFILPINFRKPYDVSNPFTAKHVTLRNMRKWNQEPTNPSVLAKNNVRFSLTTHTLKTIKSFNKNLQKAIKYGLDKQTALASLTTVPASILGQNNIGNLQKGSYANFLITSGDIFDAKTTLYENWTLGDKNIINNMNIIDLSGKYDVLANGNKYNVTITGKGKKQKATVKLNDKKIKSNFSLNNSWMTLTLNENGSYTRLIAKVNDVNNISGKAINNNGYETAFIATKLIDENNKKNTASKVTKQPTVVPVTYPNFGYGFNQKPKKQTILFKNVTVWTSEKEGILKNTDVLISNGKIKRIGKNLSAGNATVVDGTGKHLTAGIVDEHSHIATSSVNEWAQNSSAEVTIKDVINPDDIQIYRNLAGGVTSIQILHGSANPIGGRSAIIKLKWGENANGLINKDAPEFIKFALGENVKQSRSPFGTRFPQTRMGVEQVYIDYFTRAKEYEKLKNSGKTYRKDDELETLLEIINKKRFISCHSYVQSEINMLMKVAEKFNFNINIFTHILEGYKVADKMKKHGAGGSTFSDWWAYKYEVNDAIPYNASIMHNQGVLVAINSDDAEMSRRLNQEAAKVVKYGNISQEEAWKMITINPAKLLQIDKKVGSIKEGKDADVVLWSGNPLSVYSKAEKTMIEGAVYFDIEQDLIKRQQIKNERTQLINLMLQEKLGGAETQQPTKEKKEHFHCDTLK